MTVSSHPPTRRVVAAFAFAFAFACACALALLLPTRAHAQGQAPPQDSVPQLGALRTPPSPAFTLLGIEPSAVERPATPSDVALTFVNKVQDGIVPRNFAFEASPYWLRSRPALTWRGDISRSVASSLARTTSVSVATAETGAGAAPVSSLAVAFRTFLFSGRLSAATQRALEQLEQTLQATSVMFLQLMNERGFRELQAARIAGTITPEEYDTRVAAMAESVRGSPIFEEALEAVPEVASKRDGFALELAVGLLWDFPEASWERHQFRRRAIWLTPSYEQGSWTVLGVMRYLDDAAAINEDAVDWGGRAIFSGANFGVSLEFVERAPVEPTDMFRRSHRVVGIAEYRLRNGMWAVASFGKDRRQTTPVASTLVAQLGLAFSFSKDRYTDQYK